MYMCVSTSIILTIYTTRININFSATKNYLYYHVHRVKNKAAV